MIVTRSPRHRSKKYEGVHTADAALLVAERICAEVGYFQLKISSIAKVLKVEPPAIYRHYKGLSGVTNALAQTSLSLLIDSHGGLSDQPFAKAFTVLNTRTIDMFIARPGIARFLLADFSTPGGLKGFDDVEVRRLEKQIFSLNNRLLAKDDSKLIAGMSAASFEAARLGPALVGFALNEVSAGGYQIHHQKMRDQYLHTMNQLMRFE